MKQQVLKMKKRIVNSVKKLNKKTINLNIELFIIYMCAFKELHV